VLLQTEAHLYPKELGSILRFRLLYYQKDARAENSAQKKDKYVMIEDK